MKNLATLCLEIHNKIHLFFHKKVDPTGISLFRIGCGLVSLIYILCLFSDRFHFFSNNGFLPIQYVYEHWNREYIHSVFEIFGDSPNVVNLFFTFGIIFSCFLIFGFFSKFSAFALFIFWISVVHRNPYIGGGDYNAIRMYLFFLMFSRCGEIYSIDKLIKEKFRNKHTNIKIPIWPIRALQLQICLIYFITSTIKLSGAAWLNGTAIDIVLQLTEFQRFPLPSIVHSQFISHILTDLTLLIEFSFPFLVWNKSTRKLAILSLILLHLSIEYAMAIHLFEWIMILGITLFFTEEDYVKIKLSIKNLLNYFRIIPVRLQNKAIKP